MEFPLKAAVLSLLVIAALAVSSEAQLPSPGVTFIPDQLSAESSFVMIADPGETGGSVRVTWITDEGYGQFPNQNGKYICYFSDTDYMSTCGPSPFRYQTTEGNPYILDLESFDQEGNRGNASVEVDIGGLKIIPDVTINFDTGDATFLVYTTPGLADEVSFKIFNSDFTEKTSGYVPLNRITGTPYFNNTVNLGTGIYYAAFKATAGEDFGGGMIKVDMGGGGTGPSEGVIQADPIDIDVLVQAGSEPALPANKRLINTLNQTFTGISVSLPEELRNYVSITVPNSTLGPYESVFYTINLMSITSSLDVNTVAEIKTSGGTTVGSFPVKMRISYTSGGGEVDCSTAASGTECLGGLCCNGVCQKGADCCVDSDCFSGLCSNFQCSGGSSGDIACTSGTCQTDTLFCPTGMEETGTCVQSGQTGVCCMDSSQGGECSGASNLEDCSEGICCYEECVAGECCSSLDCPGGMVCQNNACTSDGGGGSGGLDMNLILIIVGVLAAAGVGIYFYMTKMKKGKSAEDEFEEGKDKDVFDEEEFY